MAEKTDWAKLSKKKLQEMLRRQEKLLSSKKFLQSLPDKGSKVTETVAKLKELIVRREQLEDTVAQFERMTVSRLVQRTQLDILDSDDSDDDMSDPEHQAIIGSTEGKINASCTGADLYKEAAIKPTLNTVLSSKSKNKQSCLISSEKWNYDSSATPPQYKLEKAKPLSLDESFKLLQDQEKKHKDLQAQHATLKLREQGFLTGTDHTTLQVVQNPLQYRETVEEDYSSDDSQQEENTAGHTEMDSDDDD